MTQQTAPSRRRPYMKDYGVSADEQGLMSWEWVDQQMEKSRNYWIASTKTDGNPHVAPVWGVWMEGALYFSTAPSARKARNIAANPEVVVHLESGDEVVIMEGRIETESDLALLQHMAPIYGGKYNYTPEITPGDLWFRFKPRVVMAWLEKDFPKTATRWDFE